MNDINPWWFFFLVPVYATAYCCAEIPLCTAIAAVSSLMISPIFVLLSRVCIDLGKRQFVIIITFCLFFFLEKSSEMLFFQNRWFVRMYANESGRAAARVYLRTACSVWCIRKQKTCGGACVCLLKAFRATAVH